MKASVCDIIAVAYSALLRAMYHFTQAPYFWTTGRSRWDSTAPHEILCVLRTVLVKGNVTHFRLDTVIATLTFNTNVILNISAGFQSAFDWNILYMRIRKIHTNALNSNIYQQETINVYKLYFSKRNWTRI